MPMALTCETRLLAVSATQASALKGPQLPLVKWGLKPPPWRVRSLPASRLFFPATFGEGLSAHISSSGDTSVNQTLLLLGGGCEHRDHREGPLHPPAVAMGVSSPAWGHLLTFGPLVQCPSWLRGPGLCKWSLGWEVFPGHLVPPQAAGGGRWVLCFCTPSLPAGGLSPMPQTWLCLCLLLLLGAAPWAGHRQHAP